MFKFLKKPVVQNDCDLGEIEMARNFIKEAKSKIQESLYQKDILELMAHSIGGMIWIKRWLREEEVHVFEFANYKLCEKLFGFEAKCLKDCTDHVMGRSDVDLVSDFREKTGKKHTFSDLCYCTDIHAVEQAIIYYNSNGERGMPSCRYLEAGFIGENPVLLDVVKTPLFEKDKKKCWNTHTYCVGLGSDASNICDTLMEYAKSLIDKGQAMKLSSGVIWLYPVGESCKLLQEELEKCDD